MAVIKCKMCGGDLNLVEGQTVAECEYCGSRQTVPTVDSEKKLTLFSRANRLLRGCEFDKAFGVYESIVAEFPEEAEAYWGLVLCRYGIEYVDDPATGKKIPTCHRSSFESILEDRDFEQALENTDTVARKVYREEAKVIEELRKSILEVSGKEEPYDIFICYKETAENGERTLDSVLAQDIYDALTEKGYRVFFSRITLEDKLGQEYEPYIFAALNSAKIMLAVGTDYEYYNAVWVKNEWSRFLKLMAAGQKKMLIPCYKGIDAYDMPKEFTKLQAQDLGKVGAMQDLLRGIEKILPRQTAVPAPVVVAATPSAPGVASLLRRGQLFLEDGDWGSADEYFNKVLDIDPENAEAYIGKLMAELQVRKQENLQDCDSPFDDRNNYQKALRFANPPMVDFLKGAILQIRYRNAAEVMRTAGTEAAYKSAAGAFEGISGYKDADEQVELCLEKAEICRKDAIYSFARSKMYGSNAETYMTALRAFQTIPGWKDSDVRIDICRKKIAEIKEKEEADRLEEKRQAKRKRRLRLFVCTALIFAIIFGVVLKTVIIPNKKYNDAVALMDTDIVQAYEAFIALEGYKDSTEKASAIYENYKAEKLTTANVAVGDSIYFGMYEQDNDTSNGKEAIEWIVLAKENGKILVLSRYALDCQPFNTENKDVTWETCTLRTWLNQDFLTAAFSNNDKSRIPSMRVPADKNNRYDTDPGRATHDRVFVLSISEVVEYCQTKACEGTKYCYAQGAYKKNGNCWWWLRTPGSDNLWNDWLAADVEGDGTVSYSGSSVSDDNEGVRPALWITLDS